MSTSETTGGFAVTTEVLARMRALLHDTAETHQRARDAEEAPAPGPVIDAHRPSARIAAPTVPSWHAELDRRWRSHRAALLCTHEHAAHRLERTVRAYLACEATITAAIRDGQSVALPDPAAVAGPGDAQLVPADATPGGSIVDLDHAASVWRRRRDDAADTASSLGAAIDGSDWTGVTAERFHEWARAHMARWLDLRRAADIIGQALTEPVRIDDPYERGPDVPELTDRPPTSGLPELPPAQPPTDLPDQPAPAPPGTSPAHPTTVSAAADVAPADAVASDPTTGQAADPATEQAPITAPDASLSTGDRSTPGAISAALDAQAPLAPTPPVPGSGGTAALSTAVGHPGVWQPVPDATPTGGAPPETMAPMLPTAAVAGATALARAERAHYVVREISVPEQHPTRPEHPAGPRTTDPVLAPPHRYRSPRPDLAAPPPPGAPPGAPPSLSAPSGGGWSLPAGRLDPPSAPGFDPAGMTPAGTIHQPQHARGHRGARRSMWVNLQPTAAHGAWIDLAARPGLGLDGPDPHAVARTALLELYLHTPTLLITPRDLLDELTTEPGHPAHTPHRLNPPGDRVQVVENPIDGVRALIHHVRGDPHNQVRHDETREPAPLEERSNVPALARACLLVVKAPTRTDNGDQLAHTLAALYPAPAAALLLGHWPHGAALDLDDHYRVLAHHQHADTDLTGFQLHPTRPLELADAVRRVFPADDGDRTRPRLDPAPRHGLGSGLGPGPGGIVWPDDPGTTTTGTVVDEPDTPDDHGRDDDTDDQAVTAPLALSVFGPIALHYQPTSPPGAAAGSTNGDPPARVAITRLPRLARELLAYLAAHPEGVLRDKLIDELCPDRDPEAKREDGALHTALSRLRSRIAETAGNDSLDDIVVSDATRWMLNPATVTVDSWELLATSAPQRTGTPDKQRRELHAVVDAYRGLFATDLPATWAHDFRVSASNRYREIIADLAEIEIHRGDDTTALDLLERGRRHERHNERIYRSIIRIHLRNGRTDDARAAFDLLRSHLAEIDAEPEPATRRLVLPLQAS